MKIQVLIAAVISSFILYGCEDNETNYLELSESSFSNVDGDGATLTVSVTSDVEWQISKTAQWCNVTPGKAPGEAFCMAFCTACAACVTSISPFRPPS